MAYRPVLMFCEHWREGVLVRIPAQSGGQMGVEVSF
jgi:hypothetical protein